jgi:hypothetical protein
LTPPEIPMAQLVSIDVYCRCVPARPRTCMLTQRRSPANNTLTVTGLDSNAMFKNNHLGCLLSRCPATSTDGLKSHSPPRPPQTPAAQFKRPYRNCSDHMTCAPPHFFFRGSPDRALTFVDTNPTDNDNLRLARHPGGIRTSEFVIALSHFLRGGSAQAAYPLAPAFPVGVGSRSDPVILRAISPTSSSVKTLVECFAACIIACTASAVPGSP